jgi:hypothetical protein
VVVSSREIVRHERRPVMLFTPGLTTARILDAFTDEVADHGGRVTDTFDDGRRLFTRSVLALADDVRPGDAVRGGVALKAVGGEVWLYPYIFRLVCRNGAIAAQAIETRHLENLSVLDPEDALQSIRAGVGACCAEEVFADIVGRMRTACNTEADMLLSVMPLLARFSGPGSASLVEQIMNQFFREGDQSRFGLANAVTAVARETRDPDLRWDLEEFGGGIAISPPRNVSPRTGRSAVRPSAAVAFG